MGSERSFAGSTENVEIGLVWAALDVSGFEEVDAGLLEDVAPPAKVSTAHCASGCCCEHRSEEEV